MHEPSEKRDASECAGAEIGLAAPDASDPLLEAFKKDVDRTLLIENLRATPQERSQQFLRGMRLIHELRKAGQRHRATGPSSGS
jgi:hypothetical protein